MISFFLNVIIVVVGLFCCVIAYWIIICFIAVVYMWFEQFVDAVFDLFRSKKK
jgi:hypothetical protein